MSTDTRNGLKVLDLSSNQISIFKMKNPLPENIEVLDLSYNNVSRVNNKSLPKNLKELYLFKNSFSERFRPRSPYPSTLEVLDLSYNSIYDFYPVSTLPISLKTLNLKHNSLSSFKKKVPVSLTKLDLSINRITDINDISLPSNLKELYLSNNTIFNNTFNNWVNFPETLEILDMSNNVSRLSELNFELNFNPDKLPQLKELYLSGNNIISFNPKALPISIEILNLSDNNIRYFDSIDGSNVLVNNLPNLKVLDLSNNNLVDFNTYTDFLGRLNNINLIGISGDALLSLLTAILNNVYTSTPVMSITPYPDNYDISINISRLEQLGWVIKKGI